MHNITRDNLLIVILVGIYICAGYFVQIAFDIPRMMTLRFTYTILIQISISFTTCFLIIQVFRGKGLNYINYNSIAGFLVIVFLLPSFQCTFASIKQVIPQIHHFCWDQNFMELDYFLHLGHHPWMLLRSILDHEKILRTVDFLYMLWFIILFSFCLWMAWSNRRGLRLQFFVTTVIVWMVFGSIFGTIFASAGPCYYPNVVTKGLNPYQSLMDSLSAIHASKPLWAIHNQIGLWDAQLAKEWLPFGGISAMPSIHVAMAVVFALLGKQVNCWLGIVLIAYAVIIQIGSVILGWHYAIDGYVSIILTILLWKLVGKIPFVASR